MTASERRHYQRIPFIADVLLCQNEQQWRCGLQDISLKGLLLIAPENFDASTGDEFSVELVLGEGAAITMRAEVSHVNASHWGMQWGNIDLDGLTHLRRLLELNMDDPAEMHRELAELG